MMRAPLKKLAGLLGIALLTACSSPGSLVVDRLDPLTGVTVTSATQPLVLYRDNSGHAAYARDYVYVGPIEVNRMGTHSYYLWFGIWSTMRDDDGRSQQRDGFESVAIYADGEPLALELAGWTLDAIGVSQPVYLKPVAGAADAYYRVTADQIRLIATAREIVLRTSLVRPTTYALWDEQALPNDSLRAFVSSAHD